MFKIDYIEEKAEESFSEFVEEENKDSFELFSSMNYPFWTK